MNEPPRLFESDPNARNAIEAARADGPDAKRLAKIGAAAAAAATATTAATTTSAAIAVKIIGAIVLVGAAVAVGVAVTSSPTPTPYPTPTPITATAAETAAATATATASASASASALRPLGPLAPGPLDEMSTLDEAQRILASDPTRALTLCDADAKANPAGSLAQEREVIAIDALMRLGRGDDAKTRAGRFHAAWPDSAHGRRVDALVELH